MSSQLAGLLPAFVLALTLLPLGAVQPLPKNIAIIVVTLAFMTATARKIARSGVTSDILGDADSPLSNLGAFVLLGLPLIATVQAFVQVFAGFSQAPTHDMIQSAALLVALAAFYMIVRSSASNSTSFNRVLRWFVAIATLEALYGFVNLLAGNEMLLWWTRTDYLGSATGTLVNRNHFAYLMELSIPIGAGLSASLMAASENVDEARSKSRLGFIAVGLMVLALFFSQSRMGILSFASASLIVLALNRQLMPHKERKHRHAKRRKGRPSLQIVFGTSVVFALALFVGTEGVLDRFTRLGTDFENGRWPLWSAAVAMFTDQPWFGHGWGSYSGLLSSYLSEPNGFVYFHAHNEYLEVLAESGIIGAGFIATVLFVFVRTVWRTLRVELSPEQRPIILGLTIGLLSIAIHSVGDFGLRVPGIAFATTYVLALFERATRQPKLIDERSSMRRRRRRPN